MKEFKTLLNVGLGQRESTMPVMPHLRNYVTFFIPGDPENSFVFAYNELHSGRFTESYVAAKIAGSIPELNTKPAVDSNNNAQGIRITGFTESNVQTFKNAMGEMGFSNDTFPRKEDTNKIQLYTTKRGKVR